MNKYLNAINEEVSEKNRDILMTLLADSYTVYTKTLNYHWNITGPQFYQLHTLLEEQYRTQLKLIDGIAEKIREYDYKPLASLKHFTTITQINEFDEVPDSSKMIPDLHNDYQTVIGSLRDSIVSVQENGDPAVEDFLIELLQQYQELAWFLRAHLQ